MIIFSFPIVNVFWKSSETTELFGRKHFWNLSRMVLYKKNAFCLWLLKSKIATTGILWENELIKDGHHCRKKIDEAKLENIEIVHEILNNKQIIYYQVSPFFSSSGQRPEELFVSLGIHRPGIWTFVHRSQGLCFTQAAMGNKAHIAFVKVS